MKRPLTYDITIDTGGTFTDCIARDSMGKIYKQKVLSNSTLRGRILEWIDRKTIRIEENWGLEKNIFNGFLFRIMKDKHAGVQVKSFDPQQKILILSKELPQRLLNKTLTFELVSEEEAPILGIRLITQTSAGEPLPEIRIKLGSTKGTNALLEKKGARILFFVTNGFRDIIEIGTQQRPDIFARNVQKPEPLYETVVEVDERIDSDGKILKPLDITSLEERIKGLVELGFDTAAVAFMNSYKNPDHEKRFKKYLQKSGFRNVSASFELSSLIKFLPRAETTVVNAYLFPVVRNYLEQVAGRVKRDSLYVMTSAGGLISSPAYQPKDSLLSGPAGGVVGASAVGRQSGFDHLISFDMGGTSTDVARFDNEYEYKFELEIGDAHIFSPSLAIETVAAGGGSVCCFDGFKLCVGPESAGAYPGPACYGAGGPLTLTDINLLAGRLDTRQFGIPVFPDESESCLEVMIGEVFMITGKKPAKEELIHGFLQIANEIMASAIKKISVSRGYDPSAYTLVAFGGAGGLHACAIADLLNIPKILMPADAGLLSAYGLGSAIIERFAEKQLLIAYEKISGRLDMEFAELENEALRKVENEGVERKDIEVRMKAVYLRFKGQDSSLEIPFNSKLQALQDFQKKYEDIYGHWSADRQIELESLRVIASAKKPETKKKEMVPDAYIPDYKYQIRSYVMDEWKEAPVYFRDELRPGAVIEGFALLLDKHSTSVVDEGWQLLIDQNDSAILNQKMDEPAERQNLPDQERLKEIELELFTNRFRSIAENMGSQLQRTSLSVNVKERLDFSCAILDSEGRLVTNAPHIPVHLGSLGLCVRTLRENFIMSPGDTLVTNHPKYGGSHLPDITVVTPVFTENEQLIGYVVNRAHHAEIGGIRPASMPPDAANLAEEGVIIDPFFLVWNHLPDWEGMKKILETAKYPSRSVEENLTDLNAALAANRLGMRSLVDMTTEHGLEKIVHYMDMLREHASGKMKKTLQKISNGIYYSEEILDDGTPLRVRIEVKDQSCRIDFTGTGPVHPGNMNATSAIVNGVVIYVLRLLIDENIPLNDGILEPVELVIPKGLLDPDFPDDPFACPAIVGGNVELSQRLTDTLLKAFGILACSQGTMNNVLFGNDHFSYYETICGGCGAGNGFHGASAVHHHMTNTRITDPEILEHRYPVILQRFERRHNSGGKGAWQGGDGVIRELVFLEPSTLSILTQHRVIKPYGLMGGEPGQTGEQYIIRKNGSQVSLGSVDGYEIEAGDHFVIKTPGGGGYGKSE